MKFLPQTSKDQIMLLPLSINDFVEGSHIVRTIDEIIERLDTKAIECQYSELGRPAFHPKMLLKILLYAYSSGLRASRKIEDACKSNLYYMYLSGMQLPDFWTICLFRRRFANDIEGLFCQVVRLCVEMGITKIGKISLDGSKLRASASAKKTKTKEEIEKLMNRVKEEVHTAIAEAEDADEEENRLYGDRRGDELPKEIRNKEKRLKKIEKALKRIEEEGKEKLNLTDGDARFMQERHGVIKPAYNCQVAVTPEQVIVGYDTVCEATDIKQLEPMIEKIEKNTKEAVEELKADCGYASEDNYKYAVEKKIDIYMPDKGFVKERKRCMREGVAFPSKELTQSTKTQKSLIEIAREKLYLPESYEKYKARMYEVEPVFGHLKFNLGYRQFLLRSRKKVKGEFGLMCMAYNLMKIWKEILSKQEKNSEMNALKLACSA
jgi:transposase